jgi:colicin import membrane protein
LSFSILFSPSKPDQPINFKIQTTMLIRTIKRRILLMTAIPAMALILSGSVAHAQEKTAGKADETPKAAPVKVNQAAGHTTGNAKPLSPAEQKRYDDMKAAPQPSATPAAQSTPAAVSGQKAEKAEVSRPTDAERAERMKAVKAENERLAKENEAKSEKANNSAAENNREKALAEKAEAEKAEKGAAEQKAKADKDKNLAAEREARISAEKERLTQSYRKQGLNEAEIAKKIAQFEQEVNSKK